MTESVSDTAPEPPDATAATAGIGESSEPAEVSGRAVPSWPEIKRLREEAGKRRHQVRELQSENAQLRERVEASDRAEVERLVGDRLVDASDIWSAGIEISGLRDDDGVLDREKVDEAVSALVERKPHYGPAPTNFNGGVRRPLAQPTSFGQALKSRLTGR